MARKETTLTPLRPTRDALALLRELRSEFDHYLMEGPWPVTQWPAFVRWRTEEPAWNPKIEVFAKDNRLVTRIELPGLKKENVRVEVTDGHLAISGERKREEEEKKEQFYRCEREYGSFYRAVPLPEGVTLEDVKATFADGVLEVSVPLPAKPEAKVRTVEIQEAPKATKAAA
jgi:HSP20 family protein